MKTDTFRPMFYIFLFSTPYSSIWFIRDIGESGLNPQLISLARVIYFFIPFSHWHIPILFLITLILIIFCVFLDNRVLRLFVFIFYFLLLSLMFSFGKIYHAWHAWLFASFFFIFIDSQSSLNSTRNKLVIRLIQFTLLLQYFSSGLWKIIGLEKKISLNYFNEIICESIANAIAQGIKPIPIVMDTLVYQYPLLLALGYVSALVFELFCIVPVLTNRYLRFTGCCIVFFHTMVQMVMGISFFSNMMAAIFFLIYVEKILVKSETLRDKL